MKKNPTSLSNTSRSSSVSFFLASTTSFLNTSWGRYSSKALSKNGSSDWDICWNIFCSMAESTSSISRISEITIVDVSPPSMRSVGLYLANSEMISCRNSSYRDILWTERDRVWKQFDIMRWRSLKHRANRCWGSPSATCLGSGPNWLAIRCFFPSRGPCERVIASRDRPLRRGPSGERKICPGGVRPPRKCPLEL